MQRRNCRFLSVNDELWRKVSVVGRTLVLVSIHLLRHITVALGRKAPMPHRTASWTATRTASGTASEPVWRIGMRHGMNGSTAPSI
eukprot:8372969-Ditylum_brightwellii.AAC.1